MLIKFAAAVLFLQAAQESVQWQQPFLQDGRHKFARGDFFWWNPDAKLGPGSRFDVLDNSRILHLTTDNSLICVGWLLPKEPISSRSRASWEWRVEATPQGSQVHRDQAIQIYFVSRIRDQKRRRLTAGVTWTSTDLPSDAKERNKYTHFTPKLPATRVFMNVRIRELARNALNNRDWREEDIDLKELFVEMFPEYQADFQNFTGDMIEAVALFADSDHTKTKTSAKIKDLTFH